MLYAKLIFQTILYLFSSSTKAQSCVTSSVLPDPISSHQVSYDATSNSVYVFGGHAVQSFQVSNAIYKWNMDSDQWSTLSVATPTDVFRTYSNNAWTISRKVYFIGIDDGAWDTGNTYIFDMETETWTNTGYIPSNPTASIYGCLTGTSTDLFYVGGQISSADIDRLRTYNIATNSWTDEQINISPIDGNGWTEGYCNIMNNNIYIFGGMSEGTNLYIIYKYDTVFKTWSNIGITVPSSTFGVAVRYNQYIYVIGGGGTQSSLSNTISEFDTESESITNTYWMPQSLEQIAAAIINEKLYIFGGLSSSGITDDVVICDILPNPTTSAAPTAIPTTSVAPTPIPITSSNPTITPSEHPIDSIATTETSVSTVAPTNDSINPTEQLVTETTTSTHSSLAVSTPTVPPTASVPPTSSSIETESTLVDDKIAIQDNTFFTSNLLLYITIGMAALVAVLCFCSCGLVTIYVINKDNNVNDHDNNVNNIDYNVNSDGEQRLVQWCNDVLKFPQYIDVFKKHGFNDINTIQRIIDASQLEVMGIVNKPHQALILWQIKVLRDNNIITHQSEEAGEQTTDGPGTAEYTQYEVEMEGVRGKRKETVSLGPGFDSMSPSVDGAIGATYTRDDDIDDLYHQNEEHVTFGGPSGNIAMSQVVEQNQWVKNFME